ncbi:hypothetical protein BFW87_03390 [Pseudomonas fluorescens]|uniref:Uncharacterized protein n=1 Tax=Pseudomonas fluorescens TaxID=294 RepID=A0A1T2Z796_PSEFL|nr:hypothetical protein [Pseudomonas fluorescens]OPA99773.1 hypothetical protein BFW87_03390 [Pseudomonas fluorescens]
MTSVNTQPQTPYTASYDAGQNPARSPEVNNADTSASADTHANSAPPKPPMTPEQRGQFSSHGNLVNQSPSQQADAKRELRELATKNNQLLSEYKALLSECKAKIAALQKELAGLSQQLDASGAGTDKNAIAPDTQPQSRVNEQKAAPPTTEPARQPELDEADELNNELRQDINDLIRTIIESFAQLKKELEKVLQQVKAMNKPESHTSHEQDPVQPATSAPHTDEQSTFTSESSGQNTPTADDYRNNNTELEEAIASTKTQFNTQISELEKSIEDVKAQINKRKQ